MKVSTVDKVVQDTLDVAYKGVDWRTKGSLGFGIRMKVHGTWCTEIALGMKGFVLRNANWIIWEDFCGVHDANFRCMATAKRILKDELDMDVYYMFYKFPNADTTTPVGVLAEAREREGKEPLHRQHEPRVVLAIKKGLVAKKAIKRWMWEHRLAWNIGHFHNEGNRFR